MEKISHFCHFMIFPKKKTLKNTIKTTKKICVVYGDNAESNIRKWSRNLFGSKMTILIWKTKTVSESIVDNDCRAK